MSLDKETVNRACAAAGIKLEWPQEYSPGFYQNMFNGIVWWVSFDPEGSSQDAFRLACMTGQTVNFGAFRPHEEKEVRQSIIKAAAAKWEEVNA